MLAMVLLSLKPWSDAGAGQIQPGRGQFQLVEPGGTGGGLDLHHRVFQEELGIETNRAESPGIEFKLLLGGGAGLADGDLAGLGCRISGL